MADAISNRRYPFQHPTSGPVSPKLLNTHLQVLANNDDDAQTAFKALMARINLGTVAVTVAAGGTTTVTVNWPSPYQDTAYVALASVEGTSLSVTNVVRSKATLAVTVVNGDGANPHSGTVMALGFHL